MAGWSRRCARRSVRHRALARTGVRSGENPRHELTCPAVSTLDRPAVLTIVRDRLADILEIEPTAIAEGASFVDDLDADSLALIELVEALEEEIGRTKPGFHIDDEDLQDLKTVRDAVDYVVAKL